ncbi:hypothetical protein BZL39_L03890 [Zygosaccharomyces parabailii]|nr:hypothetical protein BZL39_L03890 [Zygosaccharomyces parabailii]CDH17794.1 related to quinate permease [Zygosaccharomyces bailii ISA1307]
MKVLGKLKINNVFARMEERPTPGQIYNWRIYTTALLASTAAVLIGYDSGFVGGTMANQYFLKNFGLDTETQKGEDTVSNLISCFHAAAFFGALFGYPLAHQWGRKVSLLIISLVGTVGSAIMLVSLKGSLAPMYVGRVLTGLTVGASTNLTVIYLSEVAPSSIRGQIVALYEMGWRVGDLVGFWINYGVAEHVRGGNEQWVIPVAVQIIPAALFFIGTLLLKESPRWLCQVGREEEALKNLCWLRNLKPGDEYLEWEFGSMKDAIEEQNRTVGNGLLDPAKEIFLRNTKYFKRLGITCFLFILQNFMGIQALNYYSVTLFKSLGVKGTNASLFSSGFFGVAKFVCTLVYVFLIVDRFGRRIAFLVSSTFCSLFFWYIGAYLKVADPTKPGNDAGPGGKAAIGFMYLWTCSFIMAWSGGPYVWAAEVYEQNIRTFTQSLNAAVSWLPIFIMTRVTTNMVNAMHYGIFFFFACVALLSVPFVYFLVPETKGIPLEDIDRLFVKGVPARSAHKLVRDQLRRETAEKAEGNSDWPEADEGQKVEVEYVEDRQDDKEDKFNSELKM